MSTIYSFHENAPSLTVPADTDIFPVIQSGVLKQMTGTVLNSYGGGVVDTTATSLAVTQALHAGKTVTISSAVPIAITMPAATGTGAKYRFVLQVVATATSHTIKVANATDSFTGIYMSPVTGTATHMAFAAVTSATTATRSDTVSLNGTTTGGAVGTIIEITDIQAGFFDFKAFDPVTVNTTTPFSATV